MSIKQSPPARVRTCAAKHGAVKHGAVRDCAIRDCEATAMRRRPAVSSRALLRITCCVAFFVVMTGNPLSASLVARSHPVHNLATVSATSNSNADHPGQDDGPSTKSSRKKDVLSEPLEDAPPANLIEPEIEPTKRLIEFRIDVSLLNQAIADEFAARQKIDEMILGTRAVGESVTTGQIGLNVKPSSTLAHFSLEIEGVCEAVTQCTQQPVRFRSLTTTKFVGRKNISFHHEHGFVSEPAVVEAESNASYSNIVPLRQGLGERLIRRIAAQQIESSRAQAEAICAERASKRIGEMIDQRIEEKLELANRRWRLMRALQASFISIETSWLTLHTADHHLIVAFGRPHADQPPVVLNWTAQDGMRLFLPEETRAHMLVRFLAETYETAFVSTGRWSWHQLNTLRRLATQRFSPFTTRSEGSPEKSLPKPFEQSTRPSGG